MLSVPKTDSSRAKAKVDSPRNPTNLNKPGSSKSKNLTNVAPSSDQKSKPAVDLSLANNKPDAASSALQNSIRPEMPVATRTPDGRGGWIEPDTTEEAEGAKVLKGIRKKKKKKDPPLKNRAISAVTEDVFVITSKTASDNVINSRIQEKALLLTAINAASNQSHHLAVISSMSVIRTGSTEPDAAEEPKGAKVLKEIRKKDPLPETIGNPIVTENEFVTNQATFNNVSNRCIEEQPLILASVNAANNQPDPFTIAPPRLVNRPLTATQSEIQNPPNAPTFMKNVVTEGEGPVKTMKAAIDPQTLIKQKENLKNTKATNTSNVSLVEDQKPPDSRGKKPKTRGMQEKNKNATDQENQTEIEPADKPAIIIPKPMTSVPTQEVGVKDLPDAVAGPSRTLDEISEQAEKQTKRKETSQKNSESVTLEHVKKAEDPVPEVVKTEPGKGKSHHPESENLKPSAQELESSVKPKYASERRPEGNTPKKSQKVGGTIMHPMTPECINANIVAKEARKSNDVKNAVRRAPLDEVPHGPVEELSAEPSKQILANQSRHSKLVKSSSLKKDENVTVSDSQNSRETTVNKKEKKKRRNTVGDKPDKNKKKKRKSTLNPIEQAALQEGKKRVRRRTKLLEAELVDTGIKIKENTTCKDELCGQTVGNFFVLEDVLGKGGFGEARRGRHIVSNKKFAIKLERVSDGNESLAEEYKIYQIIGQHLGFPRCYYFGVGPKEHNALVMDLCGPSLEDYFRAMERKWSLKMICMVALQVLDRIEYLHSKGYIYSDVKPENFLVGLTEEHQDSIIFLIDFGLAQQFKDKETGKYCYDENLKTHPVGTMRYMSIRSHEGRSLSYRDDLESVGYLIIYFIRGRLPWQGTSVKDRLKKVKVVGQHKKNISMEDLCQDCPQELQDYMKYVGGIQFYAEPRYDKLRNFFQSVLTANSWVDDGKFDWMGKSFDFAKNKKSESNAGKAVGSAEHGEVSETKQTIRTEIPVPRKVSKPGKTTKKKAANVIGALDVPRVAAKTSTDAEVAVPKGFTRKSDSALPTRPESVFDPIQSYHDRGKAEKSLKKTTKSHTDVCGCC